MCRQSMQTKWTAPSRETRAAAPVADDPLQEFGIPAIATPHPVFSENPDIAWLRSWRCGNRRDDLVIRVDS